MQKGTDLLAQLIADCSREPGNLRDCMVQSALRRDYECRPQAYLISNPDCGACERSKDELRPHLESGAVRELDSSDPLAMQLLDGLDVTRVPALVLADCNGDPLAKLQIFSAETEEALALPMDVPAAPELPLPELPLPEASVIE